MKIRMMFMIYVISIFVICGCITTENRPNPILTSKEESWYIPKGVEFQAKKTQNEELKTYIAGDDLMVLYFGKYLEVERLANACVKKNCL